MDLSDFRVVFEANMNARVPPVYERRAHRCPIDLPIQKPDANSEFFRVIGRPPDSLAFARSDRSGRNER